MKPLFLRTLVIICTVPLLLYCRGNIPSSSTSSAQTDVVKPASTDTPRPADSVASSVPSSTPVDLIKSLTSLGKGSIRTIVWSPDGQELAVATSSGIRFIDIHSLGEIAFLKTEADILSISYSPDQKMIVSIDTYMRVYLWNRTTLQLAKNIGQFQTYYVVANTVFSADGEWLAIALYEKIYLYRIRTGEMANMWDFYPSGITTHSIAFSSDGKLFAAAGTDGSNKTGQIIRVWETDTGNERYTFDNGVMDRIWSLAFSLDNKTVIGGSNQYLRYWDVTDGRQIKTNIEPPLRLITAMSLDPQGDWLALSDDCGRMRLNSFHYSPAIILQEECLTQHSETRTLAFSPDGNMLALSPNNNAVRVWKRDNWQQPIILDGNEHNYYAPMFNSDSDMIQVTSAKGDLFDWNWVTGNLTKFAEFDCLTFNLNHQFCAKKIKDDDKQIEIINRQTLETIFFLRLKRELHEFELSPNEKWLAVGDGSTIRIWDIKHNQLLHTLEGHTDGVWDLAFNVDGTLLASAGGAHDRTVRIWNVVTGELIRIIPGGGPILFSEDGLLLTTAGWENSEISLWNIEKEQPMQIFYENEMVTAIAIQPLSSILAMGIGYDGSIVKLLDMKDNEVLGTLLGGNTGVSSLIFSFDGNTLAATGTDGIVHLWDVSNIY